MRRWQGTGARTGGHGGAPDPELVEVDAGTPAGELRYWHPFARSADVSGLPLMVRLLGEDLVAFRDLAGRIGLLDPRCGHRGASLYSGRVEADGLRCCYHGWLFATDGRCLDQPCEPDRGRNRDSYRQPWYPVREYHGLVFAYLGPADRQPAFPRYDIFEDLGDDEEIVIIDYFAFGGPSEAPCNWFQTHESSADPHHVFILHNTHSGAQFDRRLAIYPRITWTRHDWGVTTCQVYCMLRKRVDEPAAGRRQLRDRTGHRPERDPALGWALGRWFCFVAWHFALALDDRVFRVDTYPQQTLGCPLAPGLVGSTEIGGSQDGLKNDAATTERRRCR